MVSKTVYLAGLISTDYPESLEWRKEAEYALLGDYESGRVNILSPMRGKENLVKTSKDGGITDPALTSKDIIFRDYADIQASDVILCSLNLYGSNRPLVGTLFELAWAWEKHIPVVAFHTSASLAESPLMRNHPFVKECVAHYCEDLASAIDILERHYLR